MPGADFDSVGRPIEIPFDTTEEFSATVPTNRLYEIYALAFRWLATAVVGNRTIEVAIFNTNGQEIFRRQSQRVQVANEDINYVWAPGMPDESDVSLPFQLLQPMPLLQIGEAGVILIQDAAGIDVADALTGTISVRLYKAG